jgi:D-glycero-alpha-D-manno-heptose-7-phosphate kinase
MIISQTPFRISFAGGGTDLAAFYEQGWGAVLSTAIQRHMYVTVHQRFSDDVRISYSKTEIAATVPEIQHSLVREAMLVSGADKPLEVTTVADVPAGTGLGSSSSLTVGLLNAMNAYQGKITSPGQLAQQACDIEIGRLKNPIGKQDQYAAAYGGLNYIRFNSDETVEVEPVPITSDTRSTLDSHFLMLYTNKQRSASEILAKQTKGTADKRSILRTMRDLAGEMKHVLTGNVDFAEFGRLLHEGWLLKRSLGFGITNQHVDDWYEKARSHGAWGGKLAGAGGGGFLLLFAPPEKHAGIIEALGGPIAMDFKTDPQGSRIVFISS